MTAPRNLALWLLLGSLTMPLAELQAGAAPPNADRPASASWGGGLAFGADASLLARGGGGRSGGGRSGGGGRLGGGGGGGPRAGGGGQRPQTGFQAAGGGLNRGSARPTGGWSNRLGSGSDRARPSLDGPVAQRDGNRNLNRDVNRDVNRNVNSDINRGVNRDWNRRVDINRVNLYPGWARPGWGLARPWNAGWYGGWSSPSWGWWGARAATWGIASLATAAIINDAVDDAIDDHVSSIVVPNSDYQLLYGTVSPAGGSSVSFDVTANGSTYRLTADCNAGTLNGRDPGSPAEAELLNAACQVAYGST